MKIALAACVFAMLRAIILPFAMIFRGSEYRMNNAIAEDQAWNSLLAGKPDEMISARAHRSGWKRAEPFINWIFRDDLHCARAYISEMSGSQSNPIYRKE